ncbi:hypothetical protein [Leisingera sp. ANG-Vp]|uniref:hypothetical protein n=1 Tax=Leisingera sp. ANG-Vp TaxID=1577896 RepID=UPI00126A3904|nr:hypothetical protein [Leisingera sp. ANG-Vp]
MYLIGIIFAGYIDWCTAFCERRPRWILLPILFLAVVPAWLLMSFKAPVPLALVYLITAGPAAAAFWHAHSKVWQRRDQIKADQRAGALKTKKLLKGFKR